MVTSNQKRGIINGVRFLIKNNSIIRIWKPEDIPFGEFKPRCNLIVKYLIDEGFFNKKECRVEVINL